MCFCRFLRFFLSVYRCDAAVGRPALTVLTKEERANRQYSLGCFFDPRTALRWIPLHPRRPAAVGLLSLHVFIINYHDTGVLMSC